MLIDHFKSIATGTVSTSASEADLHYLLDLRSVSKCSTKYWFGQRRDLELAKDYIPLAKKRY